MYSAFIYLDPYGVKIKINKQNKIYINIAMGYRLQG